MEYRKDGIAVIDKKKKQCWIINFAISRDQNVKSKSRRKFYDPRIWNGIWNVKAAAVLIVVGALVTVSEKTEKNLKR